MDTKPFIIFLVFIPLISKSQVSQNARYISDIVDPSMINTELFFEGKYKEISGSPYLEKEMKKGVIILKDNRKVEDVMIRYNAYEDALMYQIEEDKITLLDPPVINGFEYYKNDQVFKYISISAKTFLYFLYSRLFFCCCTYDIALIFWGRLRSN